MIQRLILFVLLLFTLAHVHAQVPQGIHLKGKLGRPSNSLVKSACQDVHAGTVTYGSETHRGESNDVDGDTVYLCANDYLLIDHDEGSGNLSGDPDPSTEPGFGYAFYLCPPTISGPDLATIATDRCLIPNPDPTSQVPIFVATLGREGDVDFVNDGRLQQFFTGGQPILIWFAPITFDNLVTLDIGGERIDRGEYEGNPAGPCVHANVDEAFAVVYLNPVTADQITTNGACGGSFRLRGGLPQFDGTQYTSISITLEGNPSVQGTVLSTGAITHNSVVQFQVPQPGVYNVVVEDSKSCPVSFQVEVTSCSGVSLTLPQNNVSPGGTICVDVTADAFVDVYTFQFSVNWDPSVLQFQSISNFNPQASGFDAADFNLAQASIGRLSLIWYDQDEFLPVNLPDGATLFSICFTAIGDLNDSSPLVFSDTPTEIIVTADDDVRFNVNTNNGQINISDETLFTNYDINDEGCGNANDGSFVLTVAGGTPPYQYSWDLVPGTGNPRPGFPSITRSGGTSSVDDLAGGIYQVTITDATAGSPNMRVDTITIGQGVNLGAEFQVVSRPSCFGDTDGSIRVNILENGVRVNNPGPEYQILWTTNSTEQTITGLASGFYGVAITKDGCTATASTTLSSPGRLEVSTINITDATCRGVQDGFLSVEIGGGTPDNNGNINFQWNIAAVNGDFPFEQNISGLDPDTYYLTVTDGNGCVLQDSFIVSAQKEINIGRLEIDEVVCNGEENGEIRVTAQAIGGTEALPYVFNWTATPVLDANSQPISTDRESTLPNLFASEYGLVIQDADGCQFDTTFIVGEPEKLQVTLVNKTNVTCGTTLGDGTATLAVANGVYPYTYVWDTFPNLTDSIALNLLPQQYDVLVTDANGCTDSITVIITAPQGPVVTSIQNDQLDCFNDSDGQVSVTATAGEAAITRYVWSNGDTGPTTGNNLTPGVYYVSVEDANSCITVDSALVTAPLPLGRDSVTLERPSCPGDANGRITLFVRGDNTPFSYAISSNPGQTNPGNVFAALAAGTYTITVTDANNCAPLIETITLPDPPSIVVEFTQIDSSSCANAMTCDGQATAIARYSDGESGLFDFQWLGRSQTQATNTVNSRAIDLCGGLQYVRVTNGVCADSFAVEIPSPEAITVEINAVAVSCFGEDDGTAMVTPTGGARPYSFFWEGLGSRTNSVQNLTAGTYTVLITDANNCTLDQTVNVGQPDSLILAIDNSVTNRLVTCNGDADGIIKVTVLGGNDGKTFSWTSNVGSSTDSIAMNLKPGTYTITVTDGMGCTDTTSATIREPLPISFTVDTPEAIRCNGEQTEIVISQQPTGGQGPYSFFVDGIRGDIGEGIPVFAGDYIVVVRDIKQCTAETAISISEPPALEVILPEVLEIQLGDSLRLEPDFNTVKLLDSIIWTPSTYLSNPNIENPIVRPIQSTTYTLRVKDEDGCEAVGMVFVDVDRKRNVFIPNIFSPNFDGRNDEFIIHTGPGVRSINSIRIFDRWGALIFEQTDEIPGSASGSIRWDGRFNGEVVSTGVYVYIIEVSFEDEEHLIYRGDVTVVH